MSQIHVLDAETIDKIAAGEVVERPASVVKELVENAIDAGATSITVEIKDGGISFMRITDNGSGIAKDQIRTAFLRHATSKIESAEDLSRIASLGFRGEALSSISAVSQVELVTKTADSLTGTRVIIEGGAEKVFEEVGAPEGTTFLIRNLFFNTPVRRKFLKQPATEGGYVADLMEHLALSRPDISFKFMMGSQTKFYTSGNGELKEVIYRIYGKDVASNLIPMDFEENGFQIKGYLGNPTLVRSNRNHEIYFLNGRFIRSSVLSKAIEEGYKEYLMQHKFPLCVLHMNVEDKSQVDVNVHPTKMEVRFSDDRKMFSAVYGAVKTALASTRTVPQVEFKKSAFEKVMPKETYENAKQLDINLLKDSFIKTDVAPKVTNTVKAENTSAPNTFKRPEPKISSVNGTFSYARNRYAEADDLDMISEPATSSANIDNADTFSATEDVKPVLEDKPYIIENNNEKADDTSAVFEKAQEIETDAVTQESTPDVPPYKVVGQVFDTYIIVQSGEEMILIDQHAAHERMYFEQFKKELHEGVFQPQLLLSPIVVDLSPVEYSAAMENADLLSKLGFETDAFGESSIIIRALPYDMPEHEAKTLFEELVGDIASSKAVESIDRFEKALHTVACKKAIKGNRYLNTLEIEKLVKDVFEMGAINTCPHGRPISVSMTKYELEKQFKRIV